MSDTRDLRITLAYCLVAALAVAVDPPAAAGMALLIPLILFAPGYAMVRALEGPRSHLSSTERLLLAVTLSLAAVMLGGLLLNAVFGLTRLAWAVWLVLVTVGGSLVGLVRMARARGPAASAGWWRAPLLGPLPRPRLRASAITAVALCAIGGAIAVTEISARHAYNKPLTQLSLLPSNLHGAGRSLALSVANRSPAWRLYSVTVTTGRSVARQMEVGIEPSRTWTELLPSSRRPITVQLEQVAGPGTTRQEVRWNG